MRRLFARSAESARQHEDAEHAKIGDHDRLNECRVKAGQQIGAKHAADDAGRREAPEQLPVDVFVQHVRRAGGAGCKTFRCVNGRGRLRRRHAKSEQNARGDHAIGHAYGAIDQLR